MTKFGLRYVGLHGIKTGFNAIPMDSPMKLYIKFMVSLRCKLIVKDELQKLGLKYSSIELGQVDLTESIDPDIRTILKKRLLISGLEILDDHKSILIEKIKQVIVEMIHYSDEVPRYNMSLYLSEKLNYDYTYLANTFSEVKGITIQQFIINHKVERVKELLLYDQLSMTQIALLMNYSSPAHMSTQFKKTTGLSPTYFKKMKKRRENNLEDL